MAGHQIGDLFMCNRLKAFHQIFRVYPALPKSIRVYVKFGRRVLFFIKAPGDNLLQSPAECEPLAWTGVLTGLGQKNPVIHQHHDRPKPQGERSVGVAQRFGGLKPAVRAVPDYNQNIPLHGIFLLSPDAEQHIGAVQQFEKALKRTRVGSLDELFLPQTAEAEARPSDIHLQPAFDESRQRLFGIGRAGGPLPF